MSMITMTISRKVAATMTLDQKIARVLGAGGTTTVVDGVPRCTCGWRGRKRKQALAIADALTHAQMARCAPATPMVR
ncbi:hypothetical protein SEA_TYPHA_108 [Mycobacterium phage Typha]|uniref:Uncharacterized protein n=1 Tax=Mycobacterium phage Typha TaxID=2517971 RepID=A0A482J875_9CAUD|nr:hypothetical protein KCH40_gp061 [Mycobacterium phage Typha]QBP29763.1 hypothetical protein SEA_TYPHA_108 [Mycobacterium phage Typha]URM86550.1 hypothetical protein PBI_HILLTOPFARM_112 [Mycobacterium phage Hilltopfarm]